MLNLHVIFLQILEMFLNLIYACSSSTMSDFHLPKKLLNDCLIKFLV